MNRKLFHCFKHTQKWEYFRLTLQISINESSKIVSLGRIALSKAHYVSILMLRLLCVCISIYLSFYLYVYIIYVCGYIYVCVCIYLISFLNFYMDLCSTFQWYSQKYCAITDSRGNYWWSWLWFILVSFCFCDLFI